jgi:HSP20 family molecular chaperone IbpA
MASPKSALSGSSKTPQILSEEQHAAFHDRLRNSISQRAYDIYQSEGRQDGSDLQHWIQAENEVLQRGLEVRESGSWLALNASIPDSTADDIDICLTPTNITIHAQKQEPMQNADAHAQGLTQREIFLTQDLNTEIEPSTASATLKDQKLTIMVKKRYPVSSGLGASTNAAATASTPTPPESSSTSSGLTSSSSSSPSKKESTKA